MFSCLKYIYRTQGFSAFFAGASAGLVRQFFYGGLRISLLKPTMKLMTGQSENVPFKFNVLAAMITGGVAITLANPADTIKVKLMAQIRNPKMVKKYHGSFDCLRQII